MARPRTTQSIATSIDATYREAIRLVRASMEKLNPEGKSYLDRVALLARLQRDWREERIARGLDVENLGLAVKPKFEFRAEIEMGSYEISPEREAFNERMDAEYMSGPATEPENETKSEAQQITDGEKLDVEVV